MAEKKRRQGQKKADGRTATPKPVCPKCGEYLKTAGGRDGRAWRRIGLFCPSATCDYIAKDLVEIVDGEEENVDKVKDFAEACCDQNSIKELKEALAGEADETDMKTWNITEDQWRKALKVAIIAIENNLSVDEAIKCIS
ncbi:MAG: hypothetical protein WB014_13890 [Methanosarcina sp.]